MPLVSFLGWSVLGIACIALLLRRGRSAPVDADVPAPAGGAAGVSGDAARWCAAIEKLCRASVYVFDGGLRCLCSGTSPTVAHLIDLAGPSDAALFLSGAAAARRGEMSSWEVLREGRRVCVIALPWGEEALIVVLREKGAPCVGN